MLGSDMESEKLGSDSDREAIASHGEIQSSSLKNQALVLGAEKAYSPEDSNPTPTHLEDDETSYPPLRTVAIVMVALYIAMFLVSLVCLPSPTALPQK